MKDNQQILIVIASVLVIAGGIWYITKKSAPSAIVKGKDYWMKNIAYYKGGHVADADLAQAESTLITYEDGYLKAWSDAIDNGVNSFSYQGKQYATLTGGRI